MGAEDAHGPARLHEQGFIVGERFERAHDGVKRRPVARRPSGAAVDDQLVGVLGDLGIEIVVQHAQGGFLVPSLAAEGGAARGVDRGNQAHWSTPTGSPNHSGIAHSSNLPWRMARARFSISRESGRSSPSGGAMARTASRTRRNSGPGSKASRYRKASAPASSSMAAMYSPFSTMVRSLSAAVMPMDT